MTQWKQNQLDALERMSAVMDGEAEETSVAHLCAAWREEASARASWHAYHLIGDVLRSEDLSSHTDRDAAFLQAVRARLADEPVVLAPPTAAEPQLAVGQQRGGASRWRGWSAPVAMAAGFVAVAGALLITQAPAPTPAPAIASAGDAALRAALSPPAIADGADNEPQAVYASSKVIRDARLEQYLAAHKQFGGSSALGVPSGFLRSATVEVPAR